MIRHFIKETDFSAHELPGLFNLAKSLKRFRNRHTPPSLERQSWGMLFYKNSTRTRISFEVGIGELGGRPIYLASKETQTSRGESVADTARVMSRYLHGLVIRTFSHADVEEYARMGSIPIINALTDFLHPCQIYTDAFTLAERWASGDGDYVESLKGKKIAFLGDAACNVANSWILGANLFGMEISLAGPDGFAPKQAIRDLCTKEGFSNPFHFTTDPVEAVRGADVVYTDVWVSMGDEAEEEQRIRQMQPYSVTAELMRAASPNALFMHCLPAHPGLEVTQEVLDSPASIIFDQAENRLHVQKAILSILGQR
jgi:ornithine carbamoyltransferase